MKRCTICQAEKPETEFYKDRSDCKACKREMVKSYQSTPKRKEYLKGNTIKAARKLYVYRRRAVRKGVESATPKEIAKLIEVSNTCSYCGCALTDKKTIDHIVPLTKGGTNALNNLVVCCRSCNSSKGAKDRDTWLQEKGL